jgi:hypothetical protein
MPITQTLFQDSHLIRFFGEGKKIGFAKGVGRDNIVSASVQR